MNTTITKKDNQQVVTSKELTINGVSIYKKKVQTRVSSITNDVCQVTKQSVDTLVLKPNGAYTGIELSDESLQKLFATYTALLLEEKQKQNTGNINSTI